MVRYISGQLAPRGTPISGSLRAHRWKQFGDARPLVNTLPQTLFASIRRWPFHAIKGRTVIVASAGGRRKPHSIIDSHWIGSGGLLIISNRRQTNSRPDHHCYSTAGPFPGGKVMRLSKSVYTFKFFFSASVGRLWLSGRGGMTCCFCLAQQPRPAGKASGGQILTGPGLPQAKAG